MQDKSNQSSDVHVESHEGVPVKPASFTNVNEGPSDGSDQATNSFRTRGGFNTFSRSSSKLRLGEVESAPANYAADTSADPGHNETLPPACADLPLPEVKKADPKDCLGELSCVETTSTDLMSANDQPGAMRNLVVPQGAADSPTVRELNNAIADLLKAGREMHAAELKLILTAVKFGHWALTNPVGYEVLTLKNEIVQRRGSRYAMGQFLRAFLDHIDIDEVVSTAHRQAMAAFTHHALAEKLSEGEIERKWKENGHCRRWYRSLEKQSGLGRKPHSKSSPLASTESNVEIASADCTDVSRSSEKWSLPARSSNGDQVIAGDLEHQGPLLEFARDGDLEKDCTYKVSPDRTVFDQLHYRNFWCDREVPTYDECKEMLFGLGGYEFPREFRPFRHITDFVQHASRQMEIEPDELTELLTYYYRHQIPRDL